MKNGAVMFFTTDSMQPAPLARAMEQRGFESLWVPEHTHIPSSLRSAYPASGGLVRLALTRLPAGRRRSDCWRAFA